MQPKERGKHGGTNPLMCSTQKSPAALALPLCSRDLFLARPIFLMAFQSWPGHWMENEPNTVFFVKILISMYVNGAGYWANSSTHQKVRTFLEWQKPERNQTHVSVWNTSCIAPSQHPSRETWLPKIKQLNMWCFAGQECLLTSRGGAGFPCHLLLLPDYCHSAGLWILNTANTPQCKLAVPPVPNKSSCSLPLFS